MSSCPVDVPPPCPLLRSPNRGGKRRIGWMENSCWKITILTLCDVRYGTIIGESFTLQVSSDTTVEEFLCLVQNHPKNRQHDVIQTLQPHDPYSICEDDHDGGWHYGRLSPHSLADPPNCQWKPQDSSGSIKDAGLCDDAILQMYGHWLPGYPLG